jgi:hypothetical protein
MSELICNHSRAKIKGGYNSVNNCDRNFNAKDTDSKIIIFENP